MAITAGDSVTIEYTARLTDGAVFDTSRRSVAEESGLVETAPDREFESLTVDVGAQQVIEGLEDALIGLDRDATPTVRIPPEKAHGEWTEERVREFDAGDLREMLGGQTPEAGSYLETPDGELVEILEVGDQVVRIDFNPQLAGETLEFDIEVVSVN